jgi:hypothetical protein
MRVVWIYSISLYVSHSCSTSDLVAGAPPHVPLPLTLATAMNSNASSSLVSTGGARDEVVVVKVDTGSYSRLALPAEDIMRMNCSAFLEALKADNIFGNHLKDVPLSQVDVWVLPTVAGYLPTPAEEQAAQELVGSNIIQDLSASASCFVHVTILKHVRGNRPCKS